MRKHNGKQLFDIQKLVTTLKMGMNKELKGLSIKQKLAMNYVSKESKLTKEKVKNLKKAGLEIPVISLDHYKAEVHSCSTGNK